MNEGLRSILASLESRTELSKLSPQQIWNTTLEAEIVTWARQTEETEGTDPTRIALMAGLHLCNDSLNRSHSYAQHIEGEMTGDYWHAIMHRMEQDYANSKYWFSCAGHHPVKQTVAGHIAELMNHLPELDAYTLSPILRSLQQYRDLRNWTCDNFVDIIQLQESGQGTAESRHLLEQLQQIEISTLLDYTLTKYSQ